MLYSSGYSKTLLNDNVVNESSWDLHHVDDDEFNMNIEMNGKKYEFRNFELEDLDTLLRNNHTTDDLSKDIDLFENPIVIKPYPKYSYKITPKKEQIFKKKKKTSLKKRKRKTTPKKCLRKCKNAKKSSKNKSKYPTRSKAKVNSSTIY